ncbi:MAG: ABC transporter substrate-binding protein [Clostridium sp.]|uniref:ABC transporter substrate-binding protein n=1 Tax=Clostridium sp. TaxID=1506 RepID=UPI003EE5DCA4
MKKKLIVGLLLGSMVLTGCGQVAEEDNKEEVSGTITVITSKTESEEVLNEVEKRFKEKYPKVEDVVFEASNDYDNHIRTRMNTNDYGDVLFVPFSMSGTPKDYETYLESLGTVDDLDDKYIDVTEADYNGEVYGIPTALNSLGIIYNEEVFKRAGIEKMPTSLEEMVEACEKIKKNTDAIPFYTNYNRTLGVWGGALSSYGGEDFKEETLEKGTVFKEGQPIRQVMDLFYILSSNGLIEEDPITGDYGKSQQMLADGKVAMFMMGSQELVEIREMAKNKESIKIGSFPVKYENETTIALGAPEVIGVSKQSKNKVTAKAFVDFIASRESGYAESLAGLAPKIESLTNDEKKALEDNNVVLTAPSVDPEVDKKYTDIAKEAEVARLNGVLQKSINIGLYPNKNESYEEFIKACEEKWDKAVKNNEK